MENMIRLEVKDILYNVAKSICENADKYCNGEELNNKDWSSIAMMLNKTMPYLMNSSLSPEEVKHRIIGNN